MVSRKEAGATNGEINRELAAFKRAYSLAIQQRKLMTKPHVPTLKENNVRKGFFEHEQFESVRRCLLPAELRALVTFFYITGWRFSEVLNLEWNRVDFNAGRVYLNPGETKNDDARVFPLTDALREALKVQQLYTETVQRAQGRICPWVFHREGK
jgi:integrase